MKCLSFSFEIEKKLRQAKKKEQKKKEKKAAEVLSQKSVSQQRRKTMEDKKDNKKFSALLEAKARKEEKRKQGEYVCVCVCVVCVICSKPRHAKRRNGSKLSTFVCACVRVVCVVIDLLEAKTYKEEKRKQGEYMYVCECVRGHRCVCVCGVLFVLCVVFSKQKHAKRRIRIKANTCVHVRECEWSA